MRTSAKYLIGSLAFGLFGSSAYATQGPHWVRSSWQAPVVAVQAPTGGAFQGTSRPDRAAAEKWLETARQAMRENRADLADFAIRKAEEHVARMPANGPGLTYTTQQAREELMAMQTPMPAAAGGAMEAVAQASQLVAQAQEAMRSGDPIAALQLARRAVGMQVPDSAFAPGQMTPRMLEQRIVQDMQARGMSIPQSLQGAIDQSMLAIYDPSQDRSRVQPAGNSNPFDGRLGQEPAQLPAPGGAAALDAQTDLMRQKLAQEIYRERGVAERMVDQQDPRGGLAHLAQLRARIAEAPIDDQTKRQFLVSLDNDIAELENYIRRNLADIENAETNAERMADVEAMRARRVEVEQQLADLVEQFNTLMDQNRFMEAEVLARQAHDIAPEEPVVQTMIWKAKYARNLNEQMSLNRQKQDGVLGALASVDESSVPFDDRNPIDFGSIDNWRQVSSRSGMGRERQRTAEELRIISALKTVKIDLQFENVPLREALDAITAPAGCNVHYDLAAMMDEAVTIDTPVSINLAQPIMMESGLTLLLENLNLTYEVRNDVIRITTPNAKSRQAEPVTYYVGDLVMPIPNFVPTYNMGLGGALANAYANLGYGPGGNSPAGMINPGGMFANAAPAGSIAGQALAQQLPGGPLGGTGSAPSMFGGGPAGMGGGIQADFDPLMELIQRTIAPDSWEELGGTGRMQEFESNLSLVIYQSQEVHEQIQDLLDQLRRLQDLQITIEVRFITLQDDFFERIGVDFDFAVKDKTGLDPGTLTTPPDRGSFGLQAPTGRQFLPTSDLDFTFDQNSFGSAVPQFGGFDANTAANFGFAILSDIEVFMLLQAAQGDTRTNILQAPKVTLFNGQTAFVNDTSQRPFVTGIIPVVGDFAAAQMPVVIVLNEGTQLSVNAVATDDRRFVRLTLVPFFSQIGDVET
ncbi:MAG TPA: hypothetical protein PLI18_18570, partial [Pirellulaceae bacterium]|nr:hypothetical protein [Pirellulaceae bacterium]